MEIRIDNKCFFFLKKEGFFRRKAAIEEFLLKTNWVTVGAGEKSGFFFPKKGYFLSGNCDQSILFPEKKDNKEFGVKKDDNRGICGKEKP